MLNCRTASLSKIAGAPICMCMSLEKDKLKRTSLNDCFKFALECQLGAFSGKEDGLYNSALPLKVLRSSLCFGCCSGTHAA